MVGAIGLSTFLSSLFCRQKKTGNCMLIPYHIHCLFLAGSSSLQLESPWAGWCHRLRTFLSLFPLLWTGEGWQLYADTISHTSLFLSWQLTTAARITFGGLVPLNGAPSSLSSLFCGQKTAGNCMLITHHTHGFLSGQLITAARITLGGLVPRTEHLPLFPLLWTEDG